MSVVPLACFDPNQNLEAVWTQEDILSCFKNWAEISELDPNRFTLQYYFEEII